MNKCVTVEDMLESAIYARAHVIYTQQAEELNKTKIELKDAKKEIIKKDKIIEELKNKLKQYK